MRGPATAAALGVAFLACGCGGGETLAHHQRYLWTQKCAPCHALAAGADSPDRRAPNLAELRPSARAVRNAVVHGRPGMPRRLLRGRDVYQIATFVARETR